MKRSQGDLIRIHEKMSRLAATIASLRTAIRITGSTGLPFGSDVPQTLNMAAQDLATSIIRFDAFLLSEDDQ